MPRQNLTPRERSLALLREALTTGIRGRNREAVESAIEIIKDDGRGGLTDLHYKNLPKGQTLRDANRPGLWCYHGKRTGKAWQYRYTSPRTGKQETRTFGTYPAMSVVEAREEWSEYRAAVTAGRDPFMEGESEACKVSVPQLCRLYMRDYAKPKKRSWQEDQRMFDYDLIPAFRERTVLSVTSDDAQDLLDGIVDRGAPRSAEKLRNSARVMWNEAIKRNKRRGKKAEQERWVPGLEHNPWQHVVLEERTTATVYLNESEICSFMRNLPTSRLPEVIKDILVLQFQSVARISEVTGLVWEEIDFDHGVWNLPPERCKNGQAHRLLLSRQSQELLERRKAESISAYVFPSERTSRPYPATLAARHLKLNRDHLKVPDGFSTHGLRHTALTQIAAMGYGKHIRDRVANHKDRSIDGIYQHYEYDAEARACWQTWSDRLDAFATDNVRVVQREEVSRG
jgi:integrase